MKDCPESEVLAAWLEDGLGPTERAAVRRHLADCDDCRRSVALAGTLGPAPAGAAPAALAERAAREARRGRLRRVGTFAAAAAAAAVVVTIGLAAGSRPEPASTPSVPPPSVVVAEPPPPAPAPPPRVVVRPPQVPSPVEAPPARPEPPSPAPTPLAREERPTSAPEPRPAPPVAPPEAPPGPTVAVLREAHAPVVIGDIGGSLRIARAEAKPSEPKSFERVDGRDTVETFGPGAGLSVDGRATLALSAGARVSLFRWEADRAYGLEIHQGAAVVDTEGATQRWKVSFGRAQLNFTALNGRIAIEGRGEGDLAVTLLEGRAELKDSGRGPRIGSGREWLCDAAGRWADRPADSRRWKALAALLPREATLFAATFEEAEGGTFSYTVLSGRVVRERERAYLAAGGEAGPIPTAAIQPVPAIPYRTGLRLRIRCRSDAPEVTIHLGPFRAAAALPQRGAWQEVEVALDDFHHEGVRMVPSDVVTDVRVSLPEGRREGTLHVDAVSLVRRTR